MLRFTSCQTPLAGFVGDRLGIAVEFVDEIPRQERLREFDAGRIHVCSMCGLPYVWLISCRLTRRASALFRSQRKPIAPAEVVDAIRRLIEPPLRG